MNNTKLAQDSVNDSELQRITARIRMQRFVLFDVARLKRRLTLLGAGCGLVLVLWWFIGQLLHYTRAGVSATPLPILSILWSAFQLALVGTLFGAGCGYVTWWLLLGLFRFWRPVYVALRYSPDDFDWEYGDRPPKIG